MHYIRCECYCYRKLRVVAYPEQVEIGSEKSCWRLRKRRRIAALRTNCRRELSRRSTLTSQNIEDTWRMGGEERTHHKLHRFGGSPGLIRIRTSS